MPRFCRAIVLPLLVIGFLMAGAIIYWQKTAYYPDPFSVNVGVSRVQADMAKTAVHQNDHVIWSTVELELLGPESEGMNPTINPFKIVVDVTFSGPGGTFTVPAFYEGDGIGGLDGNMWRVRFVPNSIGNWNYISSSEEPLLDGYIGDFQVTTASDCDSYTYQPGDMPNFNCLGRLQYEPGAYYLRFAEGSSWLKGGADEPEDFLGAGVTVGFNTKEEAVDYLASMGVNSMYIMLHNIGGDGRNVWPWVGETESQAQTNHEHFDIAKLGEWDQLFQFIQSKGLVLHLVFEDDSAWTGFNRDMYYREMIARFGHYNGLYWNISEEYNENYSATQIKGFAEKIKTIDPYDRPLTVHNEGSLNNWNPFLGDPNFNLTSLQTSPDLETGINGPVVEWRAKVATSGHIIPVHFDEIHIQASNSELSRLVVWSAYMGGASYEIFTVNLTDYRDFASHFTEMHLARAFVEQLPYDQMQPINNLLLQGEGFVLAQPGIAYALYLRNDEEIVLDLSGNDTTFQAAWFNPRNGDYIFVDDVLGGSLLSLSAPSNADWVLRLITTDLSEHLYLPAICK